MRIFDITRPLGNTLAPWPGDRSFRFELSARQAEGSSVNVGAFSGSVHSGSHADAPFHFRGDGSTIDVVDVAPYVGPAWVVDARGRGEITQDVLNGVDVAAAPRLLFRTDVWADSSRFPEQIPVLAPGVAAQLGTLGVLLVGVDVPSVDAIESKDLPNHHALDAAGICILEGLDLSQVSAGLYELVALPLKIAGADGSPVRAVLRCP